MSEKLAYLAGLVDADGTVSLLSGGHNQTYNIVPGLAVSNTDEGIMDWLVKNFGGRAYPYNPATAGRKTCYRWLLQGQAAIDLLVRLRPRLLIKAERAWLTLEYWAQRTIRRGGRGARMPVEEQALRQGFLAASHYLNRVGPDNAA